MNFYNDMNFNVSLFCKNYNLPHEPVVVLDGEHPDTFQDFKKQYKKQSGIYGWVLKNSLQTYVGSAQDLGVRPFRHLYLFTKTNLH